MIFSISLQTRKHFTSSARRRLFRFNLILYYWPVFYLTDLNIVWHDFILNTGAKI